LPEEKQRLINSTEWRHSQLELPEENHTDACKHIKAIWDFIMCRGCSHLDVPGMTIQYRMLVMSEKNLLSSGYGSFQTPSRQIRPVSERAEV